MCALYIMAVMENLLEPYRVDTDLTYLYLCLNVYGIMVTVGNTMLLPEILKQNQTVYGSFMPVMCSSAYVTIFAVHLTMILSPDPTSYKWCYYTWGYASLGMSLLMCSFIKLYMNLTEKPMTRPYFWIIVTNLMAIPMCPELLTEAILESWVIVVDFMCVCLISVTLWCTLVAIWDKDDYQSRYLACTAWGYSIVLAEYWVRFLWIVWKEEPYPIYDKYSVTGLGIHSVLLLTGVCQFFEQHGQDIVFRVFHHGRWLITRYTSCGVLCERVGGTKQPNEKPELCLRY